LWKEFSLLQKQCHFSRLSFKISTSFCDVFKLTPASGYGTIDRASAGGGEGNGKRSWLIFKVRRRRFGAYALFIWEMSHLVERSSEAQTPSYNEIQLGANGVSEILTSETLDVIEHIQPFRQLPRLIEYPSRNRPACFSGPRTLTVLTSAM
jgi:hypothetical protein